MDSSDSSQSSRGVKFRIKFFEDTVKEKKKTERTFNINLEKSSEKLKIRRKHSEFIRSCFRIVNNENELRTRHEENKKLEIDNYIAGIFVDDEEKEVIIKQFCDDIDKDFKLLHSDYRAFIEKLNSEQDRVLEKAILIYKKEMDKHFVASKSIYVQELQELHKKCKNLSYNKLKTELSQNTIKKRIEEQFCNLIEKMYDQYRQRQNQKSKSSTQAIGIDLGTTYSCVGVMKRGKVHIISNTYGLKTTPSYIAFTSDGKTIVGKSAKKQAHENPVNTIYDVKRMIGRKYDDIDIQNDMKLWPFVIFDENGSLKVKLYSNDYLNLYPEQLSAKILSKLKSDAETFLNLEVNNAVITVPAYFNDSQRQATKEAGILAGLNVLQILNEPTAAAIAYNHQIRDDFRKYVLVYDLGGGTFDVAVVINDNGIIIVKAVGGDTHLGGVDFDQRVLNFLYKTFEDKFDEADDQNLKRALYRLKINCEKKKWELSEMSSTNIIIDVLLPGWDFKFELTREVFEDLCSDLFKKTIKIVDQTLKSAKMEANDISDVILIGGSTKIPKIRSLLQEYFKDKTLNKEINPDEAVAYGATIQAALLNGETFIDSNETIIQDVSPFSLGIELNNKTMSVIIPRNSRIPISKSKIFKTSRDNMDTLLIEVFEGENEIAKYNRLLGKFEIYGIPKKPAGEEKIVVTMEIDNSGILHVEAISSNACADLIIEDHRGKISADEVKTLVNQMNTEKK